MEGAQSETVGGGCKLLRSGGANEQEWNGVGDSTIQRTE